MVAKCEGKLPSKVIKIDQTRITYVGKIGFEDI